MWLCRCMLGSGGEKKFMDCDDIKEEQQDKRSQSIIKDHLEHTTHTRNPELYLTHGLSTANLQNDDTIDAVLIPD